MKPVHLDSLDTPLGRVWAAAGPGALLRVHLPGSGGRGRMLEDLARAFGPVEVASGNAVTDRFLEELTRYFQGRLSAFRTPLEPRGTDFQKQVWNVLLRIPCGETRSYAWVAAELGRPRGPRAVGQANARNPLPIIVPCHRVVAADGSLGGFSCGLENKRRLLRLERRA